MNIYTRSRGNRAEIQEEEIASPQGASHQPAIVGKASSRHRSSSVSSFLRDSTDILRIPLLSVKLLLLRLSLLESRHFGASSNARITLIRSARDGFDNNSKCNIKSINLHLNYLNILKQQIEQQLKFYKNENEECL